MIAEAKENQGGHSPNAAIDVHDLRKVYLSGLLGGRLFGSKFHALKGVSFTVNRGDIFGLLGPNGAGKTTCVKILLGIIRKSGGMATMMGQPAGSIRGRKLVGYLPEHLRIPGHLTGNTALEVYGNLSNVPTSVVKQRRERLLSLVGLLPRANETVKKYSKGMRQRLGLAQAMLHEPELLILDEPTDGLDPRARADVRNVIRKLRDEGVTIFLNSHILQEVEMVCNRVAILNRGDLLYCGPVDQTGEFVQQRVGKTGTGTIYEYHIRGDAEAINRAFSGASFEIIDRDKAAAQAPAGEFFLSEFKVHVNVTKDSEVDDLIDKLRAEDVSLLGLNKKEVSLEDAFLQIVDENASA
ncbi:MAG: ABC transporter ATP-binding protein [Planctomycetota bacterium]